MKILSRRIQIFVCILVFPPFLSVAQTNEIRGIVTDSATGQPVRDVTISVLKENKAIATSFSDQKGKFIIQQVPTGIYQLYISIMSYASYNRKISISKSYTDLGKILLKNKSITLNGIEIKQSIPPVVIKKDTLEFNASSIKTMPNAVVEELLKQVPGISVDPSGKITAQGTAVKRILVDGKPFFGDNVALTTKNLPAEIIDKIQLIEGRSDQAQFSGFDDGNNEKIINITLKKNKRRGMTGAAAVGYGTNDRYAGNLSINSFSEKDRISVIANANNLNDRFFNPGSTSPGMVPGNGTSDIWSGAVNYNVEKRKNLQVDGSYSANRNHSQNNTISARQIFLPDTSWLYNQQSLNSSRTTEHDLRMRVMYKINTSQSLLIAPQLTYKTNNTILDNNYQSFNQNKDTSIIGIAHNTTQQTTPNMGLHGLYRKKFKKPGQTFSADVNFNTSKDNGKNTYQTKDTHLSPAYSTGYNRLSQNDNTANNSALRLSYTTPFTKDRVMELSYSLNKNVNNLTNKTYDQDSVSGKYDNINDSLSNISSNKSLAQNAGIQVRTNKQKYDYLLGISTQFITLNTENTIAPSFNKSYINFFPSAKLRISISKEKAIQFGYNGSTILPTAQQLQPLPNLANSLLIQEGNPDLKPSYKHNVMVGYNAFNLQTLSGFFTFITGEVTQHKVINSTRYDSTGRQYSRPINEDGAFNLKGYFANSFLLKPISTRINLSTDIGYNRDITLTYINAKETRSFVHNYNVNEELNINYRYKTIFDINTLARLSYTGNKYDALSNNNTNYFTYYLSINYNLNLPAGIIIGNDLRYTVNTGRAAGYNTTIALLNGYIAKTLFHQQQGMIKFSGYDLLHQNKSISRNIADNYVEDTRQTVLQPYFMLSFTWFIKNYPAGKSQPISNEVSKPS
ncbi:outer membrane beta-barrel protein [Chitinophaga sancti]|uniref:outer membrane beta-barrel protein n=1 Tax=Chitinophaga sancti TaxID=1004 RepID=UPI002A74EE77|nr:outer membrane beta-barrel protein [Chitinophaga sancti]WPQ63311.1 outer membrane beta-barrel protein [Chitinophaga sancti]